MVCILRNFASFLKQKTCKILFSNIARNELAREILLRIVSQNRKHSKFRFISFRETVNMRKKGKRSGILYITCENLLAHPQCRRRPHFHQNQPIISSLALFISQASCLDPLVITHVLSVTFLLAKHVLLIPLVGSHRSAKY